MSLFFGSATTDNRCNVDCEFFINFFNNDVVNDAPLPGGFNSQKPSERIMDALGSDENTQNFVLLKTSLNGMKARV